MPGVTPLGLFSETAVLRLATCMSQTSSCACICVCVWGGGGKRNMYKILIKNHFKFGGRLFHDRRYDCHADCMTDTVLPAHDTPLQQQTHSYNIQFIMQAEPNVFLCRSLEPTLTNKKSFQSVMVCLVSEVTECRLTLLRSILSICSLYHL